MSQVIIFDRNRPDIGLYTRQVTLGEEYSFVELFIDYFCHIFKRNNKRNKLAVFVEPRIDSGFPDVVFASYLPTIIDNWSANREELNVLDLKLLSYLYTTKSVSGTELVDKLGFPEKQLITSLEKLLDAKMVSYWRHGWRICASHDVFSITKLIAVEAKLNNVSKVVEQTCLNTRFVSQSYALINSAHPQSETKEKFSKYGIGLYCKGTQFNKVIEAKRFTFPSSYVSFQFNEWIGRAIAAQGEIPNVGF